MCFVKSNRETSFQKIMLKYILTLLAVWSLIILSAAGFRGTPSLEMSLTADVFNYTSIKTSHVGITNPVIISIMNEQQFPQFSDDYFRMTGRNWKSEKIHRKIMNLFRSHALRCLFAYRKLQQGKDLFGFFAMADRSMSHKFGLELKSRQIGKGLYLGHPYNISVSENAVIGENCNLNKGASIGVESGTIQSGQSRAPILGNRVWVGANAVLCGNIKIGDNVLIAPNAYVDTDVPPNSIVIGNPAQIISNRLDATEGYINHVC